MTSNIDPGEWARVDDPDPIDAYNADVDRYNTRVKWQTRGYALSYWALVWSSGLLAGWLLFH